MAYGAPGSLEDVEAYYTHIRGGRKPSPEMVEDLKNRYRRIGGSPLLEITRQQAGALEARLNREGPEFRVFVGMKHWHPMIEEAVVEMAGAGIRQAVALTLAPHYSRMSVGAYAEAVERARGKLNPAPEFTVVTSWKDEPAFLDAVARRVRQSLAQQPEAEVVFTAHSLPEKILQDGDPYAQELKSSVEGVARRLDLRTWHFAYQSQAKTGEPWLGPEVPEVLRQLREEGTRSVLIVPIGFVSDHLEILYDVDVFFQETAKNLGITLRRTESLNAATDFIEALASVVRNHLSR
ncbi:MAG: ferrochelatase [Acidobacteria bacterium]|nr:ferrochelatase [Acidobacteriota bacterium]